ncbi:MAG: ATPase domain-containing protein, partial [Candidatus Thermoplasmatota archaeon]
AGSLKSSLAFNILYHVAKERDLKGLYLSLEQNREDFIEQMANLGMDIADVGEKVDVIDFGKLREELKPEEYARVKEEAKKGAPIDWLESIHYQVKRYKEAIGFDILVLDSLEALYALTDLEKPRDQIFHFLRAIRNMGVTALLISEMYEDIWRFSKYGESYLCDGIIHLTMERRENTVGRFLSVVKMRKTKHSTDYFPLIADEHGFRIVPAE